MSEAPKKRAYVRKAFRDEGTGKRFKVGDRPLFDAGTYANYEAAGLIGAPPPKAKQARKPAST